MGTLGVDSGDWGQIKQNYSDVFGGPFKGDTWSNIGDSFKTLENDAYHWSLFDQNVTSAYNGISSLNTYLSSITQEELSTSQLLISPMEETINGFKKTLSSIVKILDVLAGNNSDATTADKLVSAVTNVCNALTACVAPVTEIGFPEVPLLGNLGEFLKMLMQKDKIFRMLPPEIRKQVEEKLKKEKEGKSTAQWAMECLQKIMGTGWAPLLQSAWQDIVKIMANLPFLPITILFAAVSVLIDAVSQLFNVVGLGVFNFDSLIKGKKLNFDLNIQDPGFSFDPPGNIIEALGKCIPLILNSIVTLPQMIINGILENLWLFTSGLGSIFNASTYASNQFMISAINDTILSNELFIENEKYQLQIDEIDKELEGLNASMDENADFNDESVRDAYNTTMMAISEKNDQKRELQDKLEANQKKMEELTQFNAPPPDSSE